MDPLRFIDTAKAVARLSKDPSTKVGAVVLDADNNILSTGYNGFPRGVNDTEARYNNRDTKLLFVAHAEANAIAQAARVGARLLGSTMVLTALYPCSNCAKLIIQAGIKKVYAPVMSPEVCNNHWFAEKTLSETMFEEAGVEIEEYDSL